MSFNNEGYFNVTFTLDTEFDERLKYFNNFVDQNDRIDWTDTENLANYAFYKYDNSGINYNNQNKWVRRDLNNSKINDQGKGKSYKI